MVARVLDVTGTDPDMLHKGRLGEGMLYHMISHIIHHMISHMHHMISHIMYHISLTTHSIVGKFYKINFDKLLVSNAYVKLNSVNININVLLTLSL